MSENPFSTDGGADQRNKSEEERGQDLPEKFEEGKENSHQANDPSMFQPCVFLLNHTHSPQLTSPPEDQRSIANRLAAADDQNDDTSGKVKSAETKAGEIDPTAPARMHGNEPSRGAKIDKNIADEEAEIIRKMDEKKAQKN
jgi:hypothetical protein